MQPPVGNQEHLARENRRSQSKGLVQMTDRTRHRRKPGHGHHDINQFDHRCPHRRRAVARRCRDVRGGDDRPVGDLRLARYPAPARQRGAAGLRFSRHEPDLDLVTAWTYAVLAVPMLLLPQVLDRRDDPALRVATAAGAASVLLSLIGFLRWVFVVPPLATTYVTGDAATRNAVAAASCPRQESR
jgi:hypothetical protein